MQITLNGEVYPLEQPVSVAELLSRLELDVRKVAIERNLELVPRSGFDSTTLQAGDAVEIVHFIGGG